MPFERKLVYFNFIEALELLRPVIDRPDGVSPHLNISRFMALKIAHTGKLDKLSWSDSAKVVAVRVTFVDRVSYRSFDQDFPATILIERMVAKMIELKLPVARRFDRKVFTSDFHLGLEIGNMPVRRENDTSPQASFLDD